MNKLNLEELDIISETSDKYVMTTEDLNCYCTLFEPAIFKLSKWYKFQTRCVKDHEYKMAIYKAKDRITKERVVLKFIYSKNLPNEIKKLEFIRRQGGHENIQDLKAVYTYKKNLWIMVTVYCTQDSLADISNMHHMTIMKQLLTIVLFLHKTCNIIHADIKPSNLLWNSHTKKLVIIDFEHAMFIKKNGHHSYQGTSGFRAPEVNAFVRDVLKRVAYNEKIDLYSCGCVYICLLYKMNETQLNEEAMYTYRECNHDNLLLLGLLEHNIELRWNAQKSLFYICNRKYKIIMKPYLLSLLFLKKTHNI